MLPRGLGVDCRDDAAADGSGVRRLVEEHLERHVALVFRVRRFDDPPAND